MSHPAFLQPQSLPYYLFGELDAQEWNNGLALVQGYLCGTGRREGCSLLEKCWLKALLSIAAQGLDVQTAPGSCGSQCINSGFLSPPKEYIHRVGRTARGLNGRGHALLILRPEELGFLRYLKQSKVKVFAGKNLKLETDSSLCRPAHLEQWGGDPRSLPTSSSILSLYCQLCFTFNPLGS